MSIEDLRREVCEAAARFLEALEGRRGAAVSTWRGSFAPLVHHSLLRPEASATDVRRVCREAAASGCAVVCVGPAWVGRAVEALRDSAVKVCAVVGFPFGYSVSEAKALEARRAVADGAGEIDMVGNLGALVGGDWDAFAEDIAAVVDEARDAPVRVILETALHPPVTITLATRAALRCGATGVKTSTGFHAAGGASPLAVAWMWLAGGGENLKVKAAGGIRTCEDARALVAAGAHCLGTSRGPDLAACRAVVEVRPEDALDLGLVRRLAAGEFPR